MDERVQLGDVIWDLEVIEALPEGSRLMTPLYGERWNRINDRHWESMEEMGTRVSSSMAGHRLTRVGGPSEVVRPITYERYVWNWRNLTRIGSIRNGGAGGTAINQLIAAYRIDNTAGNFPAGTGMRIADPAVRDTLPLGSTIQYGNPAQPTTYGLWRKYGESLLGWTRLLGEGHRLTEAYDTPQVTVLSVGNHEVEQPWLTREADETDLPRILKFKALVWERAKAEGRLSRWCEWIDTIMWWSDIPGPDVENRERAGND